MVRLVAPLVKDEITMSEKSVPSLYRRIVSAMDDITVIAAFFALVVAALGNVMMFIGKAPWWITVPGVLLAFVPSLVLARKLMRSIATTEARDVGGQVSQESPVTSSQLALFLREFHNRFHREFELGVTLILGLLGILIPCLVFFFGLRLIAWLFADNSI